MVDEKFPTFGKRQNKLERAQAVIDMERIQKFQKTLSKRQALREAATALFATERAGMEPLVGPDLPEAVCDDAENLVAEFERRGWMPYSPENDDE